VVQSLLPQLSVEGQQNMRRALLVSQKFFKGKEATNFLNTQLYHELFDIEKAVDEGFAQFIEDHIKKLDRFTAYHKANCTGEGCELCQTTLIT
tara:strand:- start:47 stop:325 length:279 start_codon:yes stop_codon:yes gene_type:complete